MTVAPELDGAHRTDWRPRRRRHHVSLGHSGATYDAGDRRASTPARRQATHLFNRMTPLGHRAPGLAAAVLESDAVTAELICDGVHVHPAMMRVALAAKGPERIMAITDGTAGSGLAAGTRAPARRPADHRRRRRPSGRRDDCGQLLTMDQAFRNLVRDWRMSLPDAARCCSTTPAEALGLVQVGGLPRAAMADLSSSTGSCRCVATYVGGRARLDRRLVTVLFWNGWTVPAVYGGMRFAVACGVLALLAAARRPAWSRRFAGARSNARRSASRSRARRTCSLTTFDGAIEIRSWDRPEVLVEIEKRGRTQGGGRRAGRRDQPGRRSHRRST